MEPAWSKKFREGKMFSRLECDDCRALFHFSERPRITRLPQCPRCGSQSAHRVAA